MATKVHKFARAHLYIEEWMQKQGVNDESLGLRLGRSRTTVWRWRQEQHRLNPQKIAELAYGLDIQPDQLWRLPPSDARPSVDLILREAPDEFVKHFAESALILLKTGT
jgi:transcriptional regulator with XRE-family HTH domain